MADILPLFQGVNAEVQSSRVNGTPAHTGVWPLQPAFVHSKLPDTSCSEECPTPAADPNMIVRATHAGDLSDADSAIHPEEPASFTAAHTGCPGTDAGLLLAHSLAGKRLRIPEWYR